MTLQVMWYILIGVLFIGYAILDGFDLGVGAWHLFVETDEERRVLLNSIGPVWDGNEVWLVTAGGAPFLAFCRSVTQRVFAVHIPFIMPLCVVLLFVVATA